MPWGYFIDIFDEPDIRYKIRKVSVYLGQRISFQSHKFRSEHWTIVKGLAKVQIGSHIHVVSADESIHIPIKALHRVENIGNDTLEFIEVQIGSYLGDDAVRYENV